MTLLVNNNNKLYVRNYLTERVKSPGLLLLGRARKLPWTPRVNRSCSASIPVMLGWNHLKSHEKNRGQMSVLLNTKIIHVLEDSCEYSLQSVSRHPPASFAMETKQTPSTIALLSSKQYVISFILCQFYKSCTHNCQTIFKI